MRYTIRQKGPDGTVVRRWSATTINLKAPVVCGPCNNGWMSDLENDHAKPVMQDMILHGAPRMLQPSDIASIAAFAFKTTVVTDHMHPRRKPFFSSATRYRFAASLAIPDGVQMWIGAFSGVHLRSGSIESLHQKE